MLAPKRVLIAHTMQPIVMRVAHRNCELISETFSAIALWLRKSVRDALARLAGRRWDRVGW